MHQLFPKSHCEPGSVTGPHVGGPTDGDSVTVPVLGGHVVNGSQLLGKECQLSRPGRLIRGIYLKENKDEGL